jgi:DNA-binding NarL/FixJ family response regulator
MSLETVLTARAAMSKIRVLLADDHATILARVCTLLGEEFDIVGAVNNGRDAVTEVQRLNPDVLVIDISMPILDGLQAVARLRSNPGTKVVFLTVHEDQDFVAAAFSAGASGYVTKSDVTTDLVPAIYEALAGRTYVSHSIAP